MTINLCTSCDNNYFIGLLALINSICKNSACYPIVLHILYTHLSKHQQKHAQKLCIGTNLSLVFKDMSNFVVDTSHIDMQYWSKSIFYRLYIPKLFSHLDKILYIDADTLVLSDLMELYDTTVMSENQIIAMATDRFSSQLRSQQLGLEMYFNSGVILFDIQKCIDFDFTSKCLDFLKTKKNMILFPDQDAICYACHKHIVRLPRIYNSQYVYTEKKKDEQKYNIVHFLGKNKPWFKEFPKWQYDIWRKYIGIEYKFFIDLKRIIYLFLYFMCYIIYHKDTKIKLENNKLYFINKYYVLLVCVCKIKKLEKIKEKYKSFGV